MDSKNLNENTLLVVGVSDTLMGEVLHLEQTCLFLIPAYVLHVPYFHHTYSRLSVARKCMWL